MIKLDLFNQPFQLYIFDLLIKNRSILIDNWSKSINFNQKKIKIDRKWAWSLNWNPILSSDFESDRIKIEIHIQIDDD